MSFGAAPWTEQEDVALAKAINEKVSLNRLAIRFKRPSSNVQRRARGLGLEIAKVPRLSREDRVSWDTQSKI
jgi:hypothetical protein